MSAYLKRLDIADVDDTGEIVGAYIKKVHIVEVVDSDGNPWEPAPGPDNDPWDELAVSTTVVTGEPYVGEIATVVPPTITGGVEPYNITYTFTAKYPSGARSEIVTTASSSNTKVIEADEVGWIVQAYVRVSDAAGNDVMKLTTSGVGPINWRTFGNITQTVEGNAYPEEGLSVAINSPIICAVSFDGDADDVTYEWSRRGTDNVLIGTPTAAQTVITFPEQGVFTVTATLKSNKTSEWEAVIFTFIAN